MITTVRSRMIVVHAARVLVDHRAAEEVLDPDAADAVGVHGPVEQVRQRGNGPDLELQLEGRVHDLPDGAAGGARHRDQEHARAGPRDGVGQRGQATEHAQPTDDLLAQRRVVVEEAHRTDARAGVPLRPSGRA